MRHRPSAIYLGGLLVVYLGVLFFDCGLMDHGRPDHMAVRIAAPLAELGLAFLLSCWLLQGESKGPRRRGREIAAFFIPAVFGIIYISQTLTLHLSDNFITVLALENGAEGRLVRGPLFYAALALGFLWTLVFAYFAWRASKQGVSAKQWPVYSTLVCFVLLGWLCAHQENHGRLEAGYRQTPVAALLHTFVKLYRARTHYDSSKLEDEIVDTASLSHSRYPFEKSIIYSKDLPYPKSADAPARLPNVIVIFTEGLSARLIGTYGGRFPDLTPNIDHLASKSLRVDNYYNHTAATYRGLGGQLTSGYPEAGGYGSGATWEHESTSLLKVRHQSLPLLLRDAGYQSYFFSPHPDTVALNDLLRGLGFDRVFTLETALSHSKEYASRLTSGSLNDRDLFGELIDFLKQRETSHENRPMFVGTYDIGTHAFMHIGPTGQKFGDGSNNVLDRFHNYDLEFGRFLDYFLSSSYAKNTILIFTTDHATFPEPPFRAVAGDNYKPYFVDRIPLLIYDPFHQLPSSLDVRGRTSLALAPTIMQLLGIRSGLNSFVGHTLFSPKKLPFGMVAMGQEFFATDEHGVYNENEVPATYRADFNKRKQVVELYYRLERENRIFKAIQ